MNFLPHVQHLTLNLTVYISGSPCNTNTKGGPFLSPMPLNSKTHFFLESFEDLETLLTAFKGTRQFWVALSFFYILHSLQQCELFNSRLRGMRHCKLNILSILYLWKQNWLLAAIFLAKSRILASTVFLTTKGSHWRVFRTMSNRHKSLGSVSFFGLKCSCPVFPLWTNTWCLQLQ